jgi:hypothetical protein
MNNWCICWLSHIFLLGILIFKGLTARRLYKSFGIKGLILIILILWDGKGDADMWILFELAEALTHVYAEMPCVHKEGKSLSICIAGMASEKLLRRWDWHHFISIITIRSTFSEHALNPGLNFWIVIEKWGSITVLRGQSGVQLLPN